MQCEPIPDVEVAARNETVVDLDKAARALSPFKRASGLCRHCREPKSERRSLAAFCSDRCRSDFHNHDKKRGALVINQAVKWRRYRRKGDFTKLCTMIDEMIREDKASGRTYYPDPPVHALVKVVVRPRQKSA